MSYVFEKYLLLRRPVKNPADYAADNQTFLNDPAFRSAVYLENSLILTTRFRRKLTTDSAGN